jgi:hypothetical protein
MHACMHDVHVDHSNVGEFLASVAPYINRMTTMGATLARNYSNMIGLLYTQLTLLWSACAKGVTADSYSLIQPSWVSVSRLNRRPYHKGLGAFDTHAVGWLVTWSGHKPKIARKLI